MKPFARHLLAGLSLCAAAGLVSAQEFKVGIVNLDRIFREANSAKAAQAKLELGNQIKQQSEKLERDAPTLSESQRTTRQRQLVDQDRDFQRKRREFQEDLNTRKNEELQLVIERANRVVKALAESEKYDLIIQEAVYANPKHDITDKVIKSLNAGNGR